MGRQRFKYNPETCRYEPFYVRGPLLRKKVATFLLASLAVALAGYFSCIQYIETLGELTLDQKNQQLKLSWNVLHKNIVTAQNQLDSYIKKDDYNYRVILDSSPLDASIREAGIGGSPKFDKKGFSQYPYIEKDFMALDKIKRQLDVEIQSYDQLNKILDAKVLSWAARPAIQPINNTQLERLHLTYGTRFHPIFKVNKDHKGLDFAATHGTPVYATGDGKVTMAYFSGSYGNVVYLDHGFQFETRYAHLSGYTVAEGDEVKRGQLIGFVGNTGNSVAPHLHYEILIDGVHVNPINFFQRDLSNAEYQKLIDHSSEELISLD
jgi:murein DD-endopeptidase MepM/ murein hydrolase activator NlpD